MAAMSGIGRVRSTATTRLHGAALLAALALTTTGCFGPPMAMIMDDGPHAEPYNSLELHGKVGKATATAVGWAAVPVEAAIVVCELPIFWLCEKVDPAVGYDGLRYPALMVLPGYVLEYAFYYAGAAVAYPFKMTLVDLPRALWGLVPADKAEGDSPD